MKTEKIDPDPFPPPPWQAPAAGVDDLLALGGIKTHQQNHFVHVIRPVFFNPDVEFNDRHPIPNIQKKKSFLNKEEEK